MKKLKSVLVIALVVAMLFSLVSCGLSSTEKDAKKYMKAHKDKYEDFSFGSGLKYEKDVEGLTANYSVEFNFSTNKGTCKGSTKDGKFGFTFEASYDYDGNGGYSYKLVKVTKGEENKAVSAAVGTLIGTAYTTVIAAAAAQNNAK